MTITAVHVLATPDEKLEPDVVGGAPVELTVAFTDLEDFTTYTEAEGDEAARRLLIGHHRESESIVRRRGGRVLKRLGDGLMLTFPAPEAAVLACLELRETAPMRLRAGIHGGSVLVTGDDDVIGHVVNLAARVTESAQGGELVVTGADPRLDLEPAHRPFIHDDPVRDRGPRRGEVDGRRADLVASLGRVHRRCPGPGAIVAFGAVRLYGIGSEAFG